MIGAVLRFWRSIGVFLLVVLPLLLLAALALFDPRDLYTDGGIQGPLAVQPGGQLGGLVTGVVAGEQVGWLSSLCLKRDASMLARVELVRASTGRVYEARTRRWHPGERSCGPLPGLWRVALDTPPGRYRLCRLGVLRPDALVPLPVRLGCIELDVLPPAAPNQSR